MSEEQIETMVQDAGEAYLLETPEGLKYFKIPLCQVSNVYEGLVDSALNICFLFRASVVVSATYDYSLMVHPNY
jgi:hypothetical protein